MQRISLSLLITGVCATGLVAQAGPGMKDADPAPGHQNMVKSTYFTSVPNPSAQEMSDITPAIWTATNRNMTQVSTGKTGVAGLGAGEYHMCFTTSALAAQWGPAGSGDVIMGVLKWPANGGSPSFTPNTMANNLNSAGNDFGLMIDGKDGRYAALDWPAGPVLSERASNAVPFPAPVAISGAGGTYVDPAPGYMEGVLGLFWIDSGTSIAWAPLTLGHTGGQLSSAALDLTKKVQVILAPNQPHSPTPNWDANGNALGCWYSRVTGSDSDQYYSGQLPDLSGGQLVFDSTSWSNNGGQAGSYFLCAYSGHYNTFLEGQGCTCNTNSNITVSATAALNITLTADTGAAPGLATSLLAVGAATIPPIQLGGILGALGVNPLIIFGGPTVMGSMDDTAAVAFPATDASLKGQTLHVQALISPVVGSPCLTNTASPSFK